MSRDDGGGTVVLRLPGVGQTDFTTIFHACEMNNLTVMCVFRPVTSPQRFDYARRIQPDWNGDRSFGYLALAGLPALGIPIACIRATSFSSVMIASEQDRC